MSKYCLILRVGHAQFNILRISLICQIISSSLCEQVYNENDIFILFCVNLSNGLIYNHVQFIFNSSLQWFALRYEMLNINVAIRWCNNINFSRKSGYTHFSAWILSKIKEKKKNLQKRNASQRHIKLCLIKPFPITLDKWMTQFYKLDFTPYWFVKLVISIRL